MDQDRIRTRVLVSGRVQGVWFRQSTADEAHRLQVDGWVRNLPDGTVEAVFEGDPPAVATAVAYVSHGPERATVGGIVTFAETPTGERGFAVR